jgi:hypothetical protein
VGELWEIEWVTVIACSFFNKRCCDLAGLSAVDSRARTIWLAEADLGDGKRFIVCADEKLTEFLELESVIRGRFLLTSWGPFSHPSADTKI